ncbi:MAG TPA: cytochrome b/b6 domain-containing protein [Anaerolineales bacterium]|nr:cytochrome b/b6 domain-containing protein [Anaerolineales bacterium]
MVPSTSPTPPQPSGETPKTYTRFDLAQRLEHLVMLVSFTILGVTGLPQKYATSPTGEWMIRLFGGIELTRQIHHISAIVLMLVSIFHIVAVLYRIFVMRSSLTMLPLLDDFKHLFQDLAYYFGLRKHKAYYGRYNYAEKVEYLAVVWGTLVMAITGFMMWNPVATASIFPGEFIPASKAAHGGEAVLAVLSIIVWHFYHVHLKHFNKSMFTGKLTRQEMEHEHPAELELIESGKANRTPDPEQVNMRRRIFLPPAIVLSALLLFGVYEYITFEETSITYVPPGESVAVFVPLTPTPKPTSTPAPTPLPGESVASLNSWDGNYRDLFRNRCGTCHGFTAVGGLSLADYQSALQGGNSGPGIEPGDPEASLVVSVQSAGNHPGQLTPDELAQVIEWIAAGAPEK